MTEAPDPGASVEGEESARAGSSPDAAASETAGQGDSQAEDAGTPPSDPASDAGSDPVAALQQQLADRTGDLQRVQAEFLNYKRRVDRDRELVKQNATYAALAPITEVLDTIDRAREHATMSGQGLDDGFRAVAEQLERTVAGLGLTKFGAVGDPFDPTVHEALSHIGEDPDVTVTTCKVIAKAGYKIGDRVVRAAQVLVVDPAGGPAEPGPADGAPADASGEDQGHAHDSTNDDQQDE